MERREQERVADVHSKHSINLSFLLMEELVKTRGLREGPARWPRWLSRVRAAGSGTQLWMPHFSCKALSYMKGCPLAASWEMSPSWVSEIWDAHPSFPAAAWVTWGKSLHGSVRWE